MNWILSYKEESFSKGRMEQKNLSFSSKENAFAYCKLMHDIRKENFVEEEPEKFYSCERDVYGMKEWYISCEKEDNAFLEMKEKAEEVIHSIREALLKVDRKFIDVNTSAEERKELEVELNSRLSDILALKALQKEVITYLPYAREYLSMKMYKVANSICDFFETFLKDNNIDFTNEEKEEWRKIGDKNVTILFGTELGEMKHQVSKLAIKCHDDVASNGIIADTIVDSLCTLLGKYEIKLSEDDKKYLANGVLHVFKDNGLEERELPMNERQREYILRNWEGYDVVDSEDEMKELLNILEAHNETLDSFHDIAMGNTDTLCGIWFNQDPPKSDRETKDVLFSYNAFYDSDKKLMKMLEEEATYDDMNVTEEAELFDIRETSDGYVVVHNC